MADSAPPLVAATTIGMTLDRLLSEGDPLTNTSARGDNSSTAFSVGGTLGIINPSPGKCLYVSSAGITTSADCEIWVQRQISTLIANGGSSMLVPVRTGPSFGSAIIPINEILPEGESVGFVTRTAFTSQSGGAATFAYTVGFHAKRLTNDFDWGAPKVCLVIGDSIDNTTGVTYLGDYWWMKVKRTMARLGHRVRFVVKGDGGWQASHAEIARQLGRFNIPQADMIIVKIGTNDTATSSGTYQGQISNLIAWKQDLYPNAKMLILGPPPRQGTGETAMVTRRTDCSTVVTAAADPLIRFCDLGSAYTNADDTNFYTGDGTTNTTRVHPNPLGHTGIATVISTFMGSNAFYPN